VSACHVLDLIRFYMGDLSSLTAYSVNQYGRASYPFDNASIAMKFKSGGVGSLHVSSSGLSPKPWKRIEIYGDQAWLAVDDNSTWNLYDSGRGPGNVWQPVRMGRVPSHRIRFDDSSMSRNRSRGGIAYSSWVIILQL